MKKARNQADFAQRILARALLDHERLEYGGGDPFL
jgi:hypothetical protein